MPRARARAHGLAAVVGVLVMLSGPGRAEQPVEDPFSRTGVFRVLVEDDFAASTSRTRYELETDEGEVLPLTFAAPPDSRTGDRVSVTGWPGRRSFEVDEIRPAGRAPLATRRALSSWTTGAKRVLVILLNFTNDSSLHGRSVTNAQNLFFGTGSSVARYYAEASYGLDDDDGGRRPRHGHGREADDV